ncbi:MBL fold metallo-hydrolase [Pedobacter duraquae]|uniref:L-ascorbate metabolism protein UlaG (Beta-lactamase superfamily) n=1 Tax=Pedobacter duraquae TaxID=425511 RepID=A0A4R6IP30_9SPHI|nr:MBL fold metallo-hydrolase [Pedobacter duraquae]TDO24034.1 L-ascorbate metabolism protein UlaG (beta-lactamase superfamily) [Pedobacter duraquae]
MLSILLCCTIGIGLFIALTFYVLQLPVFGKLPAGERLIRVKGLPNYDDGAIQNLSHTPQLAPGATYFDLLRSLFKKNIGGTPTGTLPHKYPDFNFVDTPKITWFGHSSYLIQADGRSILVDPVFSKRTSPFSFMGNLNYPGTDFMKAEDFPDLDVVLITHDHYDHMDYQTILKLTSRATLFITSIGVGSHLERWGIPNDKIVELAWYENFKSSYGFEVTALPARHFAGRGFKRNQTAWSSFFLQTSAHKIYLGGDSGYDTHFEKIGKTYGPFDIAILECGQYNAYWPFIHMFPEETIQAAIDLKAKYLLPVHWGKFTLARHPWNEPVIRAVAHASIIRQSITTPMLGEAVVLDAHYPSDAWWLDSSNNASV